MIRRLRNFEVVSIPGPRQIGKTTLAKQVAERYHSQFHHFDLEDPTVLSRFEADPTLTLQNPKGLVIIIGTRGFVDGGNLYDVLCTTSNQL